MPSDIETVRALVELGDQYERARLSYAKLSNRDKQLDDARDFQRARELRVAIERKVFPTLPALRVMLARLDKLEKVAKAAEFFAGWGEPGDTVYQMVAGQQVAWGEMLAALKEARDGK